MHCYHNLNNDAKCAFNIRLLYIALVLACNVYNIIVIKLGLVGWLLIAVTVVNFISIGISLTHIWIIIYQNKSCTKDEGCMVALWEFLVHTCLFACNFAYLLSLKDIVLIPYEFAIAVIYMSLYTFCIGVPLLIFSCLYASEAIIGTINVVEARNNSKTTIGVLEEFKPTDM